jgi:CRP/FNR family transcriptional regulator
MAARGQSPRRFLLRMGRRDIASLLAVAHETVSRTFGLLAEWGLIKVNHRDIEILDMAGLKACTQCTRRDVDDAHLRGPNAPAARPRDQTKAPAGLPA